MTFLSIYSSSWSCSINMNKTKNLSLLSLWTVSAKQATIPVPVLTIPTQDQESLSAPGSDCLCQSRASSWAGGSVQTQDCYTQSWSCESWIFYGNFTVRWSPTCVRCHMSHVRCQVSVARFFFSFFLQSGFASCWRVCYQWGLPRLVFCIFHLHTSIDSVIPVCEILTNNKDFHRSRGQ